LDDGQQPASYWKQRVRIVPAIVVTLVAIAILLLLLL
jgi:peptidoglycan/LPS O-acetylase OafA/YrhL